MNRRDLLALLGALASPGAALAVAGHDQAPKVDPAAVTALHRMGAYLRAQPIFVVTADMSTDELRPGGQKVKIQSAAMLEVRRPDRLRADVSSDRSKEQFFYDGKTFTVHDQKTNYYASFAAPPTVADVVEVAERRYGIELPLADLFAWGADETNDRALKAATVLGPSAVRGARCTHYAFRENELDWQLWIEDGDAPLPRRLVITTSNVRSEPEHDVVMTWDLAPQYKEELFEFNPPEGAERIELEPASRPLAGARARGGAASAQVTP
jgi:hypothetical protein